MAKKILLVEDDLPTVELLKFTLQSEGLDVVVVYDGISALRTVERETPDLILLDIMIPGVDGFEVCQLLKHNIKFMHIPIIMVTAKVRREDRMLGFEKGADDYISKPFDPIELVSRVKKLLKKKDLETKEEH